MGYDKKPGRFGGGDRGGFGGGRDGGRPKELFSATCATCQKECQVPFRPSGERPVYCVDCFRNVREDSGNDFSRPPRSFDAPKRDFAPRRDFGSKPSFNQRPVAAPAVADTRIGDLQKQVAGLHVKIDTLMALLTKEVARPATPAPAPVVANEVVATPKKTALKKKAVAKKK